MKYWPLVFILTFLACQDKFNSSKNLSPELLKAVDDFEIMEGFKIELVASEPLITDPVAMEIDENGDLYVLEMPGYPLDLTKSGRIKKLIDTNGDGLPDSSIVFADSLTLPMGLMKWKEGLIVADSPDIFYLEDLDGDGITDRKDTIITGFSLSNPQHNMNTPKFGVDNWIYIAHSGAINSFAYEHIFSDKGNEIYYPNITNGPRLPANADGRNVRLKPNSYELETLSGESQYGHTSDPWGRRFYTDNANHLFHEVIDARYLRINPNLNIDEAMQKIPDHGNACEVFPITENPNHQLLTDIGVITSSCGVTWYDGGAFGDDFENITLIGEPVHNLIHIDRIEENGATFTASRVLENKEFLASKDPWFRPVFFYVGPDGAIYVIDYYRQIIEHPEWMSEEVNESGALYEGSNKGRIYRISKKEDNSMKWLNNLSLSTKSPLELVALLSHKNGWYRRTAQRLLFQKGEETVAIELHELIKSNNGKSVIPALWLLYDWKQLNPIDLQNALASSNAGVRENALQLADKLWSDPIFNLSKNLEKSIRKIANDSNAKVRYQWLCSSAFFSFEGFDELKSAILVKDIEDEWVGIAAIAASYGSEMNLMTNAIRDLANTETASTKFFFTQLAATLIKKGEKEFIHKVLSYSKKYEWCQSAMLDGIALAKRQGAKAKLVEIDIQKLASIFLQTDNSDMRKSIIAVLSGYGAKIQNTEMIYNKMENSNDIVFQADAMKLLSAIGDRKIRQILITIILKPTSDNQQLSALKALPRSLKPNDLSSINTVYSDMKLESRNEWIFYLAGRQRYVTELIRQVELGNISRSDLQWPQIVGLMNYYDTDIRNYARKVFAINEDRKAVLQNYLPAADLVGKADNGRVLFQQNCSICHQVNGKNGSDFGPDLATLKNRNKHSIITEVINPNNSIADKYGGWTIKLKNGSVLSGIIINENEENITIKKLNNEKEIISKVEILKREINKVSMMPNGFENSLTVEELADLVAFIKRE